MDTNVDIPDGSNVLHLRVTALPTERYVAPAIWAIGDGEEIPTDEFVMLFSAEKIASVEITGEVTDDDGKAFTVKADAGGAARSTLGVVLKARKGKDHEPRPQEVIQSDGRPILLKSVETEGVLTIDFDGEHIASVSVEVA